MVTFTHIEALTVNSICIYDNTGNIHITGTFFVAFIGADYNRSSWIYKITQFNYWVMVVLEGEGGGETFAERRLLKSNNCKQGVGEVQILVILWECNNWMTPLVYCGWTKKVWIASFTDRAKAIDWNVAVFN